MGLSLCEQICWCRNLVFHSTIVSEMHESPFPHYNDKDSVCSAKLLRRLSRKVDQWLRMEALSLMFEWYDQRYWGAAHGLAGIMHVLMDVQLKPDEAEDVKGTIKSMINNRFPSGNYPASEEDRRRDLLVHWCQWDCPHACEGS